MTTTTETDESQADSTRGRRGCLRWLGYGALTLLVLAALAALMGYFYGESAEAANANAFPPPGELVDVGGRRLHLYCTGVAQDGRPTVILENLQGGLSSNWGWVQPAVAESTRVCSYDRAGSGWSEASAEPLTLDGTVDDLHTLLVRAEVPPPYVLAGHSIGGIYTRAYAAAYPDEVAGLVLIDSSHPEQFDRYPQMADTGIFGTLSPVFPWLARLGLFHLYFDNGGEIDFQDLPPRQHDEAAAFWSSPAYWQRNFVEQSAIPDIYVAAGALGDLGDRPLAVVTAGQGLAPHWTELQNELAGLSSDTIHTIIDGGTHSSLVFDPDHARQTSQAILAVVDAAQ